MHGRYWGQEDTKIRFQFHKIHLLSCAIHGIIQKIPFPMEKSEVTYDEQRMV